MKASSQFETAESEIGFLQNSSVKVSVIMPLYNDELYVAATLDSLLAQTLRDIEIIIVEDCSTDKSLEIAKSYEIRDSRITIITHEENKGGGAARNTGMKYARGEYLSFLDSDDYFYPNMLEAAYRRAKQFDADICVFNTEYASGKTPVLNFNHQYIPKKDVFSAEDIPTKVFEVFNSVPWNKIFRHSFVKETGIRWSETFCSNDVVFVNSHMALAKSITAISDVLIRYENRAAENSESKYNFYFRDAMGVYIELARILRSKNAFSKKIYQSFISRVSSALNWQLKSVNMADKRAEYIQWLKSKGLELLGFRSAKFEDYLISNDSNFSNYLNIQKLLQDEDEGSPAPGSEKLSEELHSPAPKSRDSAGHPENNNSGADSNLMIPDGVYSYLSLSGKHTIHRTDHYRAVVYATNESYLMPLSVSVISLLDNAETSTFYDIYILSGGISGKQKTDFLNAIHGISENNASYKSNESKNATVRQESREHDFRISFIDVDRNIFGHLKLYTEHLDLQCFYRLLIPGLLPHVDKAIYIDCDTIICKDLSELYTRNMNMYYVMGVKAAAFMANNRFEVRKLQELGIPSMKQYINSGFLVMNLANMRRDSIQDKFLELANRNFMQEDQDVINVACYDHIRHLPLKYNVMIKYFGTDEHSNEVGKQVYSPDEIAEAMSSPVIIHYANKTKPWNDFRLKWANRWLQYAEKSALFANSEYFQWPEVYLSFRRLDEVKPLSVVPHRKFVPDYGYHTDAQETGKSSRDSAKHKTATDTGSDIKLSVIVPLYNAEKSLPATMESLVLNLSALGSCEAILIDDNSYDRTLDLALSYTDVFPFIRVYSLNENCGAGKARNFGISKARGEYVAFLDGDDEYYSYDSLKTLYSAAREHNALACGGGMAEKRGTDIRFGNYDAPLNGYAFQQEGFIEYRNWQFDFGFHRFVFKREYLTDNGIMFPEERRYQDVLFLTQALSKAGSFYALPTPVYVLNVHESKFSDSGFVEFFRCMNKVLEFAKDNSFDILYKLTVERYLYFMINLRESVISSTNKKMLLTEQIKFTKKFDAGELETMGISAHHLTLKGLVEYYYPHITFSTL